MTSEELAEHLAAIRSAAGALTPESVVAAAADPAHPLHDWFNWDDSSAADAWRRQQARILIARVRIIVPKTSTRGVKEVNVRALASVTDPLTRQREYLPVSEINNDPVLARQVMESIRLDIVLLRRKYAAYGTLLDDALRAELEELVA